MRTALIGHRGVGKTAFLERVRVYYAEMGRTVEVFDLDGEIETHTGKKIRDIFTSNGEEPFRRLEREVFQLLDKKTETFESDVYVAIGAGFDPSQIPNTWRALWIRRPTDVRGRIFLDRPRLDKRVPPLEEFTERYHRRQTAFRARADEVLMLDEGLDSAEGGERDYVLGEYRDLQGAITVVPDMFRTSESFERWAQSRINWGVRWFELRDDLLDENQVAVAMRVLPEDRVLLSFRKAARTTSSAEILKRRSLAFDWPVEFGLCPFGQPRFLSLHERAEGQSLTDALARFPEDFKSTLKAALPVHNFKELEEAHQWQLVALNRRVFLPISSDGRWYWYRLLQGRMLALNYFRESDGANLDQPTLLQWSRQRAFEKDPLRMQLTRNHLSRFAAVLGDPVMMSRTPLEQRAYFALVIASMVAIRVSVDEWNSGAMEFLRKLGLAWAAVTAPLKREAFKMCAERDSVAESLGAVNTLEWNEKRGMWSGTNTDLAGFKTMIKDETLGSTAVWGGGGTLKMLMAALPGSEFYSARTGENRDSHGPSAESFHPDTVIWAVGRRKEEGIEPPVSWSPQLIVDLNYSEDSPGRAFALKCGSRYISGLAMFRAQAEAQRRFWKI